MPKAINTLCLTFCLFLSACSTGKTRSPQAVKSQDTTFSHITVVIDPGHGGHDGGASTLHGQMMHEKFAALSTSLMVRDYLRQKGFRVLLTRDDDRFIPLKKRAGFSNEQAANLFVSIHYNAALTPTAHGIEVFYYNKGDPMRVEASKRLAQKVLDRVIGVTGARERGVKHGNFSVIRNTVSPAILFEGGFLTNAGEAMKIRNASYQSKIAKGIAKGILDFVKEKPR